MPHKTHVLDGRVRLVDSITQLDAGAAARRVDGLSLRPPRADVLRR